MRTRVLIATLALVAGGCATAPKPPPEIALQEDEELVSVSAGDTVRSTDRRDDQHQRGWPSACTCWSSQYARISKPISSSPPIYWNSPQPSRPGGLRASWDYPLIVSPRFRNPAQRAEAAAPVAQGIALERLAFRYDVTGDAPSWRPLRAFDDGERVYIQFPAGIAQGELPPLFVVGANGGAELVNYRYRAPYYIVDRLFGAAELRLGGDKAQTVRISRTDGTKRAGGS